MKQATIENLFKSYTSGKSGDKRLAKKERKNSQLMRNIRKEGRGKVWKEL